MTTFFRRFNEVLQHCSKPNNNFFDALLLNQKIFLKFTCHVTILIHISKINTKTNNFDEVNEIMNKVSHERQIRRQLKVFLGPFRQVAQVCKSVCRCVSVTKEIPGTLGSSGRWLTYQRTSSAFREWTFLNSTVYGQLINLLVCPSGISILSLLISRIIWIYVYL